MRENEEKEGVMGDAGTLGNGMRYDRNRRDRQLSTAWMEKLDPFVLILLWPIYARKGRPGFLTA
jgi:hypothetical protein